VSKLAYGQQARRNSCISNRSKERHICVLWMCEEVFAVTARQWSNEAGSTSACVYCLKNDNFVRCFIFLNSQLLWLLLSNSLVAAKGQALKASHWAHNHSCFEHSSGWKLQFPMIQIINCNHFIDFRKCT
jgi:hypothetical protein